MCRWHRPNNCYRGSTDKEPDPPNITITTRTTLLLTVPWYITYWDHYLIATFGTLRLNQR
jgi:hypothetical protein